MRKWIEWITTLIIIVTLGFTGYYFTSIIKNIGFLISTLQNKIEIYEEYRLSEIELLIKLMEYLIKNDRSQTDLLKDITKDIEKLDKNLLEFRENLRKKKAIDLDNVKKIKQANITIYNTVESIAASGSHIKIKGKDYILTCGHIIENEKDFIWGVLDNNSWHPLELVKLDIERDMSLFRIYEVGDLPYLEISNESPKEGSEVVIIGNPEQLTDVITDGVISKIEEYNYILTNKIYFGNSGGAILYKGKIVGVVNSILVHFRTSPPTFVNYSRGSNLESVKEFLKGIE